jgi:hypothetical protein
LIAGGVTDSTGSITATAELYDTARGLFFATGKMTTARRSHTATLLPDGRVLVAGGHGPRGELASAELYDPSTGTFAPTGDMISGGNASGGGRAILLPNGQVFIAVNLTAQLYEPATGTFTSTGSYADNELGVYTATMLADGRILMTGCANQCETGMSELYDPATDRFSGTGMRLWENVSTATLLMNGKVLFAGNSENSFPADGEAYDPATGTFTGIWRTVALHDSSTATLLPDGTVLIAGAQVPGREGAADTELYAPATGNSYSVGNMITVRNRHTATILGNGTVLIAGGFNGSPSSTSSAEIYTPPVLQEAPVLLSLSGYATGQGAIQHAGTYRIASGGDPAVAGEYLSIYLTGLTDGSVIPPQIVIGGHLAEITFFGNVPGYTGLNVVNLRMPAGVPPGDAVPVRLSYLSRPSNEVTIGVQ